jgi:hypothetical protein
MFNTIIPLDMKITFRDKARLNIKISAVEKQII